MASAVSTREEIVGKIVSAIENEFHTELMDIYAVTVALADTHPEQANNEIRNALNHWARALCSETLEAADDQIKKAQGHIERAKRDCLKIAIIAGVQDLSEIAERVAYTEGALAINVKKSLKNIKNQRKDVITAEKNGKNDISDMLLDILNEIMELRDRLFEHSGSVSFKTKKILRFMRTAWKKGTAILSTLFVAYVITGLVYLTVPDKYEFLEFLKPFLPSLVADSKEKNS